MNTITLEVSTDELKVLVQALDLATKSGGLQAAQVTLPIAVKLQMALDGAGELKTAVAG